MSNAHWLSTLRCAALESAAVGRVRFIAAAAGSSPRVHRRGRRAATSESPRRQTSSRRARRGAARRPLIPGAASTRRRRSSSRAEAARIDFVDIATPPYDHARIAHVALDQGLHVLCEKPLATTPPRRAPRWHARARAKRVLFPCHNYKHAPVVKAVAAGARVGPHRQGAASSRCTPSATRTRKGVQEWRPTGGARRSTPAAASRWITASHTFYLAFDWLGALPDRHHREDDDALGDASTPRTTSPAP